MKEQQDIYLSESLGLWMEYLVAKNDAIQFKKQISILHNYFLTRDTLVVWKIYGNQKAPANAFIDDLRIIGTLYTAGEK